MKIQKPANLYTFRAVANHHRRPLDCREIIPVNLQAEAHICIPIPHHRQQVHLITIHYRGRAVARRT